MTTLKNHIGLVLLVDFKNCNPQGDPDAGNEPRTDPETGNGLITAQGPKRKIRDYLALNGHPIYVSRGACLQRTNRAIANEVGITDIFGQEEEENEDIEAEAEEAEAEAEVKPKGREKAKGKKSDKPNAAPKVKVSQDQTQKVYQKLCSTYIDARLFGQLVPRLPGTCRGPIQFSMGESISPVTVNRMPITRVAVATEAEEKSQGGGNRMMGSLLYIPYGLYRFHIYVNPSDAAATGCTEKDYELFLQALTSMFDNDRSSVRSSASVRGLYEFRMGERRGAVNMERVLESVLVERRNSDVPPRSFNDYRVEIHPSALTSNDFTFRRIVDERSMWEVSEAAE